ncbi:MAG: hypothetical protein R3297_10365, partial [Desulfobulbales bacterium]|nr:hypothetical protein [Desulfobulbales bacterium]
AEYPQIEISGFAEKYSEAKKSLEPVFYENTRISTPTGRNVFLSGWLIPKVKNNQYNGMTCTIRDTTRSRELDMLLKMSLDNSPYAIGISKLSEAGTAAATYFTNKRMRRLFGQEDIEYSEITLQESLDRCEDFITNKKEWRKFLQQKLPGGKPQSLTVNHTNGRKFEWTREYLLDSDGKPWGRMAVVKEVGRRRRKQDK